MTVLGFGRQDCDCVRIGGKIVTVLGLGGDHAHSRIGGHGSECGKIGGQSILSKRRSILEVFFHLME